MITDPDNKIHGANMGPTWGRQDPGGPHVGPMNLVIWGCSGDATCNSGHVIVLLILEYPHGTEVGFLILKLHRWRIRHHYHHYLMMWLCGMTGDGNADGDFNDVAKSNHHPNGEQHHFLWFLLTGFRRPWKAYHQREIASSTLRHEQNGCLFTVTPFTNMV